MIVYLADRLCLNRQAKQTYYHQNKQTSLKGLYILYVAQHSKKKP